MALYRYTMSLYLSRSFFLFLLLLAMASCWPLASTNASGGKRASRIVCYVSPEGNDTWSGTMAAANATHTDGPFRTLPRALEALRAAKSQPVSRDDSVSSLVVRLHGGVYELTEPLHLTGLDSGGQQRRVVIEGDGSGGSPVISGGTRITGWRNVGGNRWEVRLPDVASGRWNFSQLYVNGARRYRPRLPKQGFYFIAGDVAASPSVEGKGFDRFHYKEGDIKPDWANRSDIEVMPFHIWTMSRFRIAGIDGNQRIVSFTGHTRGTQNWSRLPKGNRYLVENVKEALSEPGEWYLDRPTGVLAYLAKPGEDPNRDTVVAPRLDTLVTMDGVAWVSFRGVSFAHSAWNSPPEGNSYPQAEINVPAALRLSQCHDVLFEGCAVRNIGNYGIEIGAGCVQCGVISCTLRDLGAGGIKIGTTTVPPTEAAASQRNTVRNCLIAEGGRILPAAVGIWVGQSPYNLIEHNEIVDFYYTGISAGWTWGYGPSMAHHNTFAWNHIHRIGQGVLSDMGGIYTLGVSTGTVLDHNWIHDVASFDYGGWGIYFDEGSTGINATNNLVYDLKSAPFHQHYGTNNLVENNILALGREAQLMRTRADNNNKPQPDKSKELSFTIRHNLVYGTGEAPLFASNWTGSNFALEYNLYWNGSDDATRFPGNLTLAEWQKEKHDKGSLVADPQFVAPDRGDFTLLHDTAARKVDFAPFDVRTAGRTGGNPYSGDVPRAFPPPPPPQPLADDWEDAFPGARPSAPLMTVSEDPNVPDARIRVTNETAASGKNSIKFTDAPGQAHSYDPHLFYRPRFLTGTVVGKFALRREAGAVFYHEWRDAASPYQTGPSLRVGDDGVLVAGGQRLLTIPAGRWVRFEIICALGDAATGTYDLSVTLPGDATPHRYPALPCGSGKAFRTLRWWGFVADGTGPGVFYLDDLSLLPQ